LILQIRALHLPAILSANMHAASARQQESIKASKRPKVGTACLKIDQEQQRENFDFL